MRLLGELQDTMKPLPSIDGQLSLMTAGAEERKSSAFTFSQEIIDAILTRGSGISEGKMRIYEQFQKSLSAKENADFLKNEYGWGGSYPVIVGAGIYCTAIMGVALVLGTSVTAFAANDPITVINNLSTFIFGLIRAIGLILLGFGVVQVGLSLKSHDPSQRANGFLTLAGGVIITFAKEILDLIVG